MSVVSTKHVRYPNLEVPYLVWKGEIQTRYVGRNDPFYNQGGHFILKLEKKGVVRGQFQTRIVYEGGVKRWDRGVRYAFREREPVAEGTWMDSLRNTEIHLASGMPEAGDNRPYYLCPIHVPHGQGVLKSSDGRVIYEGSWKDGCRDGSGDGESGSGRYFGEWVNGLKEGDGVFTCRGGESLKGKWINDAIYDATGVFMNNDDALLTGEFRAGVFQGVAHYPTGDEYEGKISCGRWMYPKDPLPFAEQVSEGTHLVEEAEVLKFPVQYGLRSIWDRIWLSGAPQGNGSLRFRSGGSFVCYWQNGQRHGFGTLTWPDGRVQYLLYNEGELVLSRGERGMESSATAPVPATTQVHRSDTNIGSGGVAVDTLVDELKELRVEKSDVLKEAKELRANLERISEERNELKSSCVVIRIERDQLKNSLDESHRQLEKEGKRRKVAEECIEKLDEEMKNLQQVQQRRIQARVEEVRRQLEE